MTNIWCYMMLALLLLLQTVVLVVAELDSLPEWKSQLIKYRKWSGTYEYQNGIHACRLIVHSVQSDIWGGASVSFKSDQMSMDMNAYSSDNKTVWFKKEAQDINHPHFSAAEHFQFTVHLERTGNTYYFLGNITTPVDTGFGPIHFAPQGKSIGSSPKNYTDSSSLSIGLAVGISLFMLVVCIVAGIVILRWAIRKGYLRHVAMSYKNFRNPRDVQVSFDSQQPSDQVEANVHI